MLKTVLDRVLKVLAVRIFSNYTRWFGEFFVNCNDRCRILRKLFESSKLVYLLLIDCDLLRNLKLGDRYLFRLLFPRIACHISEESYSSRHSCNTSDLICCLKSVDGTGTFRPVMQLLSPSLLYQLINFRQCRRELESRGI